MSAIRGRSLFHVGDRVRIGFGRRKLTGVIVEDRGAIGVRGRRLYQVNVPMDPFEPMMVELPEDEMEAVVAGTEPEPQLETQRVMDYLANGGLISILRSNLSGGRNQPRVWLTLDNLGNVTHTFVPERGVIGGQTIPFGAVHGEKIFTAKQDSVVAILESFGLDRQAADRLIAEVGTNP